MKQVWFFAVFLILIGWQPARAAAFVIANGDVAALRAAITTANGNNQDDVIILATNGTYAIPTIDNTSANGANGLPVAQADNGHALGIIGSNTLLERSPVSGTPEFRILEMAANSRVILSGLMMGNGITRSRGGGAIFLYNSTLSLSSCTLTTNTVIGVMPAANPGAYAQGGAICNDNAFGEVTGTDCTFINNSVTGGAGAPKFDGGSAEGGAIFGANSLTRCTFTNNSVTGGLGGNGAPSYNGGRGGSALGGAVRYVETLTNCTFSHNTAQGGAGGALATGVNPGVGGAAASGAVAMLPGYNAQAVVDCYFVSNSASGGTSPGGALPGSADGGALGIYENGSLALSVTNSTFELNSVTTQFSNGGAISLPNGAHLLLQNCTLVQNSAAQDGGAILARNALDGTMPRVDVYHCTFSGNSAASRGGLRVVGGSGHVANTIFKKGASGSNVDSIISQGHNLSDDSGGGYLNASGDLVNTNPQLATAAPANNGGRTRTIALLSNSPAINQADEIYAPRRDQRGDFRTGQSDIGAFEYNGSLVGSSFIERSDNIPAVDTEVVYGHTYRLERRDSLTSGSWLPINGVSDYVATDNFSFPFDDPSSPGLTRAFYHVLAVQ